MLESGGSRRDSDEEPEFQEPPGCGRHGVPGVEGRMDSFVECD